MKALLVKMTVLIVPGTALQAWAQVGNSPYLSMAPIDQYMMPQDAEIALARSAAPESLSLDAEVMVLGQDGYKTVVKGKNGFVCIVERGWTAGSDSPDFWNPKLRGPICFNAAAARSYLPQTISLHRSSPSDSDQTAEERRSGQTSCNSPPSLLEP